MRQAMDLPADSTALMIANKNVGWQNYARVTCISIDPQPVQLCSDNPSVGSVEADLVRVSKRGTELPDSTGRVIRSTLGSLCVIAE